MQSKIDLYKKDLNSLRAVGDKLHLAIQSDCFPKEFKAALEKEHGSKAAAILKTLPSFKDTYQSWYSEARALIKQMLPDRLADFVRLYEKPKSRKTITYESYTIEDFLQGLHVTRGWEKELIVGPSAAIPNFRQQMAMLISVQKRFDSSLFDIRQLVQGDLFESELDAGEELLKNKFVRAAGALAGVVLERHLNQICTNHNVNLKKNPGISDFNDALKKADVLDVPQWRSIQYLADIRNLCDHDKKAEPTIDQVKSLIDGTKKIIKTAF